MDEILASVEDFEFEIESILRRRPLIAPKVKKRPVLCTHWLRGLCKKGDEWCDFLHIYDISKMPECRFYTEYGECSNETMNGDCPFRHIDPESKMKDCPWFQRGFCKHGAKCRNRHVKRVACQNYIYGFCPEGKMCKFAHPIWHVDMSKFADTDS
eukprot:Sdes_comp22876_c0_seq1m21247